MSAAPSLSGLLLALVLVPGGLEAQASAKREGFWWGFGVGYGSWHFDADSAARRSGDHGVGHAYGAAGWTIDPHWTVGLEAVLGAITGTPAHVSSLSIVGAWYPWRASGWFVRAGLGTNGYRESSGAESPDYRGNGPGYMAAIGVDVMTSGGVSLTPMLAYRYGSVGTVGLGLPFADLALGFRQRTIGLTVGLTFP